jgi:hypothetical protein
MPVGWFIAPYDVYDRGDGRPVRRNAPGLRFQAQITADGGTWRDFDLPKGNALVKVRASAATLQAIAAEADITRLPKDLLDSPLADLTVQQRNAIQTKLNELGYSNAEITAALGADLRQRTLREVLRLAARRMTLYRRGPGVAEVLYDGGELDHPDPEAALTSLDGAVT